MKAFVSSFVNRTYEKDINKKMLYYTYDFPKDEVAEYVNKILNIPLESLVDYAISTETDDAILAKDVFQFSDFDVGTIKVCNKLLMEDNPGVTYMQAGKLLLDDGIERKDAAYNKYGENHLKLSEALGLTYELTYVYFVSCLGMIYVELSEEDQKRLINRLLLRSKFFLRLIKSTKKATVDLRQFLYMLSDSTYVRRRSNIKCLIGILLESTEYDFSFLMNNLKV